MKSLSLLCALALGPALTSAEPRIQSWFTDNSGQYARLYQTSTEEATGPGAAVTTWNRGQGLQAQPTYAGVHEVSSDATDVYIRSTGLASYIMGPWYLNAAKTNLFPNYPANTATIYRLPLDPGTPPASKTQTGLGAIGIFVDGVAMFDSRDAFSYDTSAGQDDGPNAGRGVNGDGIWNRDAFVNEGVTFDAGNAHQAGPLYHYHANPAGLRNLLGDSVDYNSAANTYTENFNGEHSPVIGWVRDSYPVYGPYGYHDANDSNSPARRMISGFQKRNGTNGSTALAATGRTSFPQWAADVQGLGPVLAANQYGPNITAGAGSRYELGHYLEDYAYQGDLGMTQGASFDLDRHNGRFCVTPEFPAGTYAYFTSIEANGTPSFPYNIGRTYYGNPSGGRAGALPAGATVHYEGGPEVAEAIQSLSVDDPSGEVIVSWNAAQGGSYDVESSPDLAVWSLLDSVTASSGTASLTDAGRALVIDQQFYRATRTALAPFDDNGFDYHDGTPPGGGSFAALFPTTPPLPPQEALTSVTVGGVIATITSYNQATGEVSLDFDESLLTPGSYIAILTFTPRGGASTQVFSTNQFTIREPPAAGNNVLILIVDDWGIDASPIDNPGGTVANMPTLQGLAASGVRFINAYAQPVCSPTRATMMTGRHPFRHGVGTPRGTPTLPASELSLPELFTQERSPYATGCFGKWHLGNDLGNNNTGPADTGGWQKFAGIIGGGVQDYLAWRKVEDGVQTNNVTTYTTTDQVNEAVEFIRAQGPDPWFVWMAFNAPHTPFHNPPAGLAPPGGYSAQAPGETNNSWNYRKTLEALDTEISRLLASVDLAKTTIILIGDNGTPGQVVQAPFGPTGAAGHSKGALYEGGVHVPMVVTGPSVTLPASSVSDKLVHCIDLFSTVLELTGINEASAIPGGLTIDSISIVPILQGTDTADRCIIVEKHSDGDGDGRGIILDDYPDYKLIIFGDKDSTADTPTFEFYHISIDPNEQSPLTIGTLSGVALDAYNACLAKDAALGGGYSDPFIATGDTVYLEVPNITGPASPPNNANIAPTLITIDDGSGTSQTATSIARFDQSEVFMRYWVKCTLPPGVSGPYSNAVVTFPDNPNNGAARVFTAIQIVVAP
jgi:arylsulfatase A-like enzyme